MASGFFSDGSSAERFDVEVHLGGSDLTIRSADRKIDECWPGEGIYLVEETYVDKPVRMSHECHADARLTVNDADFLQRLIAQHPHLARRVIRGSTGQRIVVFCLILLGVLGGLILGAPKMAKRMAHHVPDEWAAQLGESLVGAFLADETLCTSTEGRAVLDDLARELLATSGYDGPFTLSIVDDALVNAFAAPAGQVMVFRGLIDEATSGDQVAGVLAHELAHVIKQHPIEGLAEQVALRFVLAAIVGDLTGLSATIANLGGSTLLANYSRATEAQADEVAVRLLNDAGYSAAGLSGFFGQLQEIHGSDSPGVLSWLSSHPAHDERIEAVNAQDRGGKPAMNQTQFAALQSVCEAPIASATHAWPR